MTTTACRNYRARSATDRGGRRTSGSQRSGTQNALSSITASLVHGVAMPRRPRVWKAAARRVHDGRYRSTIVDPARAAAAWRRVRAAPQLVSVANCETYRGSGNRCKVEWMVTAMKIEDSTMLLVTDRSRASCSKLKRLSASRGDIRSSPVAATLKVRTGHEYTRRSH